MRLDVEQQWPELFEQLEESQRRAIIQTLACAWHEGWVPCYEDVKLMTSHAEGSLSDEGFLRLVQKTVNSRCDAQTEVLL